MGGLTKVSVEGFGWVSIVLVLDGSSQQERGLSCRSPVHSWRQEWTRPFELARAPGTWSDASNPHDLHSALGYRISREVEMEDHNSHSTRFVAA